MASNETTTKFKVDISELKKGIQEANRQIRLANAEFKAASSGMDDWRKSTDGLSAKINALDKTLSSQKAILASYKQQLELITAEYGDNSREADEMRIKIANQQAAVNKTAAEIGKYTSELDKLEQEQRDAATGAQKQGSAYEDLKNKISQQEQTLANLKRKYADTVLEQGKGSDAAKKLGREIKDLSGDLEKNKDRLKDVDAAADGMDEGFEEAADGAATFGDVLKANIISDAIKKGIEMLGDAVRELGDAFKEAITGAAEYADQINTMSQVTGLSTEALQEYSYMAPFVDVSIETISGSLAKLTRNMSGARDGTGAAADAFNMLGVSVVDSEGQLRSNQDVFDDVIDALGGMTNETERDAAAMAIFGRSAQDLNPLIAAGSDRIDELRDAAHEMGYVMDNEGLQSLVGMQDAFDEFDATIDTVKRQLAVSLAPIITDIAGRFSEWIQTIDWDAVAEKIGIITQKLMEWLDSVDWDGLFGHLSDIGEVIGTVVDFIIEHHEALLTAIGLITAAIVAWKVAQLALNIAMYANPIILIITLIAGLIAAVVAIETKTHAFSEFFKAVWEGIKTVVGAVVNAIVGFFTAAWEVITTIWGAITGFFANLWEGIKAVFAAVVDFFSGIFQRSYDNVVAVWTAITGFFSNLWEGIKAVFAAVVDFFSGIFQRSYETVTGIWSRVTGFFSGIWEGIKSIFSGVADWFRGVFQGAADVISNIVGGIVGIVKLPVNGIIGAINTFIRGLNRIRIPDWVPVIGGRGVHISEIPYLAAGGVLERGQVGLLEGNGAEAVVPLENNRRWIAATARDLRAELDAQGIIGGGRESAPAVTNNYNYQQINNSPKPLTRLELYRQTRNQLNFAWR